MGGVDPASGKISRIDSSDAGTNVGAQVTLTPFFVPPNLEGELPPVYYAVAWRDVYADVKARIYRIAEAGTPQNETVPFIAATLSKNAGDAARVRLAPLGTGGLMSAITDDAGHVRPTAWEAARTTAGSGPAPSTASALRPCRSTTPPTRPR